MAFWRDLAACPFCGATAFSVGFSVNDMPKSRAPSEVNITLYITCSRCANRLFQVVTTQGGQLSAVGVSMCRACQRQLLNANNGWYREEDIPVTTYAINTPHCPRCDGQLESCWWRGWNYVIGDGLSPLASHGHLTAHAAIARGHLVVSMPTIIALILPLGVHLVSVPVEYQVGVRGIPYFAATFLASIGLGWLTWSVLIPRWRLWAYERVASIAELKNLAARASLIWPEGHLFERTEIASRGLRQELKRFEELEGIKG